jgi:hypothetical protein
MSILSVENLSLSFGGLKVLLQMAVENSGGWRATGIPIATEFRCIPQRLGLFWFLFPTSLVG